MVYATHRITVFAIILPGVLEGYWSRPALKDYVSRRVKEIGLRDHPYLESFEIDGYFVEINVLIHVFPAQAVRGQVGGWIENHIIQNVLELRRFEIEMIMDLRSGYPEGEAKEKIEIP